VKISIALVEPKLPINVGHIARLMKNFGIEQLLLVKPEFKVKEASIFAVHGKDLLDRAKVVSFKDLKKFDLVIGTTAICSSDRSNVIRDSINPSQLSQILVNAKRNVCIVLGRESTGLNNAELSACDVIVSIDTLSSYRTLNISHALAILLYEINRNSFRKKNNLASVHEKELLIDYALKLAKISNYRRHKTNLLAMALKRLLGRNLLTSKEAMLMVTLFRQALLTMERKR
jgi:TrmH family RNA methyltransferase